MDITGKVMSIKLAADQARLALGLKASSREVAKLATYFLEISWDQAEQIAQYRAARVAEKNVRADNKQS
jgi:hypothetical protein